MTADEAVRLLARIARTGPPAAPLRAIEMLGAGKGLFQDVGAGGPPVALSDEERAGRRFKSCVPDQFNELEMQ